MNKRGKEAGVFVLLFFLIYPILLQAQPKKQIIEVVVDNAAIREGPDPTSEIIQTVSRGELFDVEKKVGSWYEIKVTTVLGITVTGYIHQSFIRVLGEAPPVPLEKRERKKAAGFLLEAFGSYFQPSDQVFKDIYGNGTFFGGEIGLFFRGVGIWAGGHFYAKNGLTTFTQEETEIQISPVYGGLKFRVPQSRVSPYLGVGVGYFKYKETSPMGTVEKADIGYIGQLGCIFKIIGPIMIDIKASYSYCKVKPMDVEANLGGLQGMVGFGVDF